MNQQQYTLFSTGMQQAFLYGETINKQNENPILLIFSHLPSHIHNDLLE
jgi:hypothetical protein